MDIIQQKVDYNFIRAKREGISKLKKYDISICIRLKSNNNNFMTN